MAVFNIRGPYGSGKSTLVADLLAGLRTFHFEKGSYTEATCIVGAGITVLGDYRRHPDKTSGCDALGRPEQAAYATIHGTEEKPGLVEQYAMGGRHVVFEGAMISARWGRWEELGHRLVERDDREPMIMCFMDTPKELCEERVFQRKGKVSKWLDQHWAAVARSQAKAYRHPWIKHRVIQHLDPVASFRAIFAEFAGETWPSS